MRTVTTTGTGSVTVARDTAVVRISVSHGAGALAEALAGAESARSAAAETARVHIDAEQIASEGLEVWPSYDDRGRPRGFEARHALSLRCTDLDVAGRLVTELAESVGDRLRVDGVTLLAEPSEPVDRAVRESAFADARSRAEHLAGLAGATLGEVRSVVDGSVRRPLRPAVRWPSEWSSRTSDSSRVRPRCGRP